MNEVMAGSVRRVLYISFWGIDDPLMRSTAMPTIEQLLQLGVEEVLLCTVERGHVPARPSADLMAGVEHVPLRAMQRGPKVVARSVDHLRMVRLLRIMVRERAVDLIVARSSLAGALAHGAARGRVPYVVESFEPHGEYMVDNGVWPRGGVLAGVARLQMLEQMRSARALSPVSYSFARRLVAEGVDPSRIHVVPCPVDLTRFGFSRERRNTMRAELGWGGAPVGIYVGRFGGMYHIEEAFRLFGAFRHHHPGGRMVVLTPEPTEPIRRAMEDVGFPQDAMVVKRAAHADVPAYLDAADVAFATYRSTPSSAFLSPVKVGEYWASGLPVMITAGVGDEEAIIREHPEGGVLIDPMVPDHAASFAAMQRILALPDQRMRTMALAQRYRSPLLLKEAYRSILLGPVSGSTMPGPA